VADIYQQLDREWLQALAPPPKLTVSEWADLSRRLSRESAASGGQWRTAKNPMSREIMELPHRLHERSDSLRDLPGSYPWIILFSASAW